MHAYSLVDPRTGVHTQEVESARRQLKLGQKRRKGLRREVFQSYLDERMERGQLSSDYAQFPCHFPATISNRSSGTLTLNQPHSRKKKNRQMSIDP